MKLKAMLPLMLCSSFGVAQEYRSFSDVDYSRTETGSFEFDDLTIGSTWYFDRKEALGPLNEFEYINSTSNIFGSYSRFDGTEDFDTALIGGEYFAGNVLLGGSYRGLDQFDVFSGSVGYLFTSGRGFLCVRRQRGGLLGAGG